MMLQNEKKEQKEWEEYIRWNKEDVQSTAQQVQFKTYIAKDGKSEEVGRNKPI